VSSLICNGPIVIFLSSASPCLCRATTEYRLHVLLDTSQLPTISECRLPEVLVKLSECQACKSLYSKARIQGKAHHWFKA
jgi:hypothetical protein